MEAKNYRERALDNASSWESLSQEQKLLRTTGGLVSESFFYLGDNKQGREAAAIHSAFRERLYHEAKFAQDRMLRLFDSALYASLAQNRARAETLWYELVHLRRTLFPENKIKKARTAECWIYEAYAFLKLSEYDKVETQAQIGLGGLRNRKGRINTVRQNVREYGLVGVMTNLSAYLLSSSEEAKTVAQKSLEKYKRENIKYGRSGYDVIFDLQFSYPEVFTPVLPGTDPEWD